MAARYINADLNLVGASDLQPLLVALQDAGLFVLDSRQAGDGTFSATLETGVDRDSPEGSILEIADAVRKLNPSCRQIWNGCQLKELGVGVEGKPGEFGVQLRFNSATLTRITEVGATLTITVYEPRAIPSE